MHEIKRMWCQTDEEWNYTKGVQRFIKAMKWRLPTTNELSAGGVVANGHSDHGGITWIELHAIYTVHGGGKNDQRLQEEDPLKKTQMLQPKIAELKKAVRKIKKHAVKTEDEWMFDTCYATGNRLKDAGIENRQAAIKGMPCLDDKDAEAVMRLLIALRGINSKKQVEAWREGGLKVAPQRLRLQKMAAGWSKAVTFGEDWIGENEKSAEPSLSQAILEKEMPLTSISCPKCEASQDPKGMRLITAAGFSNIMCSLCKWVSPSSIWKCRCRIPWIKCHRHVQVPSKIAAKPKGRIHRSRIGKSFDKRGRDVQIPIKRRRKSKFEHPTLHVQHNKTCSQFFSDLEIKAAVSKIKLEPGSSLAAKFPHLVKAAAPT